MEYMVGIAFLLTVAPGIIAAFIAERKNRNKFAAAMLIWTVLAVVIYLSEMNSADPHYIGAPGWFFIVIAIFLKKNTTTEGPSNNSIDAEKTHNQDITKYSVDDNHYSADISSEHLSSLNEENSGGGEPVFSRNIIAENDRSASGGIAINRNGFADVNFDILLKRAFLWAEEKDWNHASKACEALLMRDPENAGVYLCKLLIELKIPTREKLVDCNNPLTDNLNFKRACRYGDASLRAELENIDNQIIARQEVKRQADIYSIARATLKGAKDEAGYKQAADEFRKITGYLDSEDLYKLCLSKCVECHNNQIYNNALNQMHQDSEYNQEKAIELFKQIPGWRDSDDLLKQCNEKKESIKKKAEKAEKAKTCRRILISIVFLAVAALAVTFFYILPNRQYNQAVTLYNSGDYDAACEIFQNLNYKDSKNYASQINIIFQYNEAKILFDEGKYEEAYDISSNLNYEDSADIAAECLYIIRKSLIDKQVVSLPDEYNLGDIVTLGFYEQSASYESNGLEAVEWIVVSVDGDNLILISKYCLDVIPFNEHYQQVTWDDSTLKEWLDNEFKSSLFIDDFADSLFNEENSTLTILSIKEAQAYLNTEELLTGYATISVRDKGAYVSYPDYKCNYWLRPDDDISNATAPLVSYVDGILEASRAVDGRNICVRPAMFISKTTLENLKTSAIG